jgi:hypothetical protein
MEIPPTTNNNELQPITDKPFRCLQCGRPLGYVQRRDTSSYLLVVGEISVEITGHAYLNCPCGGRREWHPGEAALAELLRMAEENRIKYPEEDDNSCI